MSLTSATTSAFHMRNAKEEGGVYACSSTMLTWLLWIQFAVSCHKPKQFFNFLFFFYFM